MNTQIDLLKKKYFLPIDEHTKQGKITYITRVMQQACAFEMTKDQYLESLSELIGTGLPVDRWTEEQMPKYVFLYTVQNIVNNYIRGTNVPVADAYQKALIQASAHIKANPWIFATGEDENKPPKLDANGNVQPRKGDKKVLAKKVYQENLSKNLTRKEWIALLVAEVGLTPAGASTYYQNLKNGTY